MSTKSGDTESSVPDETVQENSQDTPLVGVPPKEDKEGWEEIIHLFQTYRTAILGHEARLLEYDGIIGDLNRRLSEVENGPKIVLKR